ncbi:MAG: hypothetical protein ACD_47C00327G0001 [uncultured bacterium]|nr:MAG: hypothetical protein ACD_47C00327G0001 [uncultured bacterium]
MDITASSLAATMEAEIKKGSPTAETYVLLAIAKLANGDVESFVRNVKKANKVRYYKFKPHPLSKYEPFVNRFVNVLRTMREIDNRFEIYPRSSMLHYQTALLCDGFSRKLAIYNLQKALRLNSDFLDAHLKIAELYELSMDYNRAIEHWREIMDIRPYDFRPYYKICHLASKFGNFTIARGIYELGMRKKMSLHEHKEFQQVVTELVADFPRLASEREVLAQKLIKLKEVVQADPLNIDALVDIAETYFTELSDIKNAEQACVKAIHIDQLNYRPHLLYSKILECFGDVDKAYFELLFAITEGGAKIKAAYITELTDLYERKLISDMVEKKLRVNELVDYFSVYYNE